MKNWIVLLMPIFALTAQAGPIGSAGPAPVQIGLDAFDSTIFYDAFSALGVQSSLNLQDPTITNSVAGFTSTKGGVILKCYAQFSGSVRLNNDDCRIALEMIAPNPNETSTTEIINNAFAAVVYIRTPQDVQKLSGVLGPTGHLQTTNMAKVNLFTGGTEQRPQAVIACYSSSGSADSPADTCKLTAYN